jgi:hypothetical protein
VAPGGRQSSHCWRRDVILRFGCVDRWPRSWGGGENLQSFGRIAAAILGHASLVTTERHFNQACALEAARDYQKVVLALSDEASAPDDAGGAKS